MPKPRIMIVEDEDIIAKCIKGLLECMGYEVPAVESSGEAAVEKAVKIKPDLILMDIVLEGKMDGIKAARKILSGFHVPVVFLTGYANEEILDDAKTVEPYGYLVKPVDDQNLRATIEMALHKFKAERKLA